MAVVEEVVHHIYRAAEEYDPGRLEPGSRGRVDKYLRVRLQSLARAVHDEDFRLQVRTVSDEVMLLAGYRKTTREDLEEFDGTYRDVVRTALSVGARALAVIA